MRSQVIVLTVAISLVSTLVIGSVSVSGAAPRTVPASTGDHERNSVSTSLEWDHETVSGETNQSCGVDPTAGLNTSAQFLTTISECAPATESIRPVGAENATATRFLTLVPGNESVARYPAHATRIETPLIADAHVTVFGVHPSTRLETSEATPSLLIAPRGTLRAFIDYRLTQAAHNGSAVKTHGVEAVRLRADGVVVAERATTTHTPVIDYTNLPSGPTQLAVEADIRLAYNTTTASEETEAQQEVVVTVRESMSVVVSEVRPETIDIVQASYATGETVVSIGHPKAQQIELTVNTTNATSPSGATPRTSGTQSVEANHVWRRWQFYTSENASWNERYTTTATNREVTHTDAAPVLVHAIPTNSETTGGDEMVAVADRTPLSTQGPSTVVPIRVTTVDETTQGRSVTTIRLPSMQRPEHVSITGLVQGERTTIDLRDRPVQQARELNISATVQSQSRTTATLSITLRDNRTGEPVVLPDEAIDTPTGHPRLFVDGQPVTTDRDGRAVVTIENYGPHEVAYQPGGLNPTQSGVIYRPTSTTVTWHPLTTAWDWLDFFVELLAWALCGLGILYGGRQIGRLLQQRDQI